MAFAVTSLDERTSQPISGAPTSVMTSNVITPTTGAFILVSWSAVWQDAVGPNFVIADSWGNSYTSLTLISDGFSTYFERVAYAVHAGSSTGTVTVTPTAGIGFHNMCVDQVTGAEAVIQTQTEQDGFTATPSLTFGSAIQTDSMIWASCNSKDNVTPTVSTSGYTELGLTSPPNWGGVTETAYNTNTGLGQTVAWTGGGTLQAQAVHALELSPGEAVIPSTGMQVALPVF